MRTRSFLAATALAVTALTSATAAAAPPAADDLPDDAATAARVAGDTRAETAGLAATAAFPSGATQALIARSDAFPDALAASYLAGVFDFPVLLTDRDEIPLATLDALEELGVERVTLLGLESAIPDEIADTFLELYGEGNVGRLGGDDRYATAAAFAAEGGTVGLAPDVTDPTGDPLRTAVLALGTNFPDALAAGPLAFANNHPILLTEQASLPVATQLALEDTTLDIEQVIVAGGPVAVSDDVLAAVAALPNIDRVVRVAGDTRTDTAVRLGELTRTALDWPADSIALATGRDFPDALTLAPFAARTQSTLFLAERTDALGFDTFLGINALCGLVDDVVVAGGPVALTDLPVQQALLATTCADTGFAITGTQAGAAADPTVTSGTGGDGLGLAFTGEDRFCYAIGMEPGANYTPVTLSEGIAGTPGRLLATMDTPTTDGFAAGCLDRDELASPSPDLAALQADIAAFPAGYHLATDGGSRTDGSQAIEGALSRGQLAPIGMRIPMSGDLEVTTDDEGAFTGLVDDPAAGSADLTLFGAGDELCFTIDVAGLQSPADPTVAGGLHLHEGAADQNGPIILPLGVGPIGRTDFHLLDCVTAPDALADGLEEATGLYANLHSVDRPAGALRGQLGALETLLNGSAEVDDSDPAAPVFGQGPTNQDGLARILVGAPADEADGPVNVCIEISFPNGLQDGETIGNDAKASGVHLHTGRVDQNGPIVIGWDGLDGGRGGADCTETTQDVLAATIADASGHYINVHTTSFADGLVRGQLAVDVPAILTGLAEVGDDGTPAVGDLSAAGTAGVLRPSDANPDLVCARFSADGLDRVQGAHVHQAEAGTSGPVVVPFSDQLPEGSVVQTQFGCAVPDTDDPEATATAIFEEPAGFYVNIHTSTFPTGAVRGQLIDLEGLAEEG